MAKTPAQQAAIAIAMKKAGKKPKSANKGAKIQKSRVSHLFDQLENVDKDGTIKGTPADRAAHLSFINKSVKEMVPDERERADVMSNLARRRLKGEDPKKQADVIAKMKDSGFGKAKKGMKFNPKYTRGSSNIPERKKLMAQIAAIYKKYRGTKSQRKKKGFPPAVEARLKRLMAKRDKL